MEIHFYESEKILPQDCRIIYDWKTIYDMWESATKQTKGAKETIHTTQMCMLSTSWILNGYRMFVHQYDGVCYEIVLRDKYHQGNNAVRIAQNVYGMWSSGVFRR